MNFFGQPLFAFVWSTALVTPAAGISVPESVPCTCTARSPRAPWWQALLWHVSSWAFASRGPTSREGSLVTSRPGQSLLQQRGSTTVALGETLTPGSKKLKWKGCSRFRCSVFCTDTRGRCPRNAGTWAAGCLGPPRGAPACFGQRRAFLPVSAAAWALVCAAGKLRNSDRCRGPACYRGGVLSTGLASCSLAILVINLHSYV